MIQPVIQPAAPAESPELEGLSTDDILAELKRRQGEIHRAHERRTQVLQQLAAIEMEIVRLGGSIPGRAAQPMGTAPGHNFEGSARPSAPAAPNELEGLTLPRAMTQLIRIGEIFSPKQATERLLEAGFKTRSQSFRTAVTQTLSREKGFRRIGHGRYERVG